MNDATATPTCHDLDALPADLPPLSVALGVFDGVHRGHQALLADACEAAPGVGGTPAALTFHPHPAAVIAPSRVPPLLNTLPQRVELLGAHGARIVVVARFDRAFARQTPEEFVEDILRQKLRARAVIVGEDFRYGCDRRGDVAALRAAGERLGFAVRVVSPVFVDGVPARSTGIRQMIAGGQVEAAAQLLGRPYTLRGVVVRGRGMGRTLGYPTANVQTPPEILVPGTGIYAGRVRVGAAWHRAAISVGTNPTVAPESATRTVEAYLMDGFDRDIYGEEVAVAFSVFLRAEQTFDSLSALTAQIGRDVEEAAQRLP